MIAAAERPIFYTGGGIINSGPVATQLLRDFARLTGAPVTSTLMGLGAYPATDKQFVGMLGMHGTYEANMAMQDCDVLLAVGARFDDRVIGNTTDFLSKPRTIIHIDIDPASISKRVKIDVPIVGDVKSVLADMNEIIATEKPLQNTIALNAWFEQIKTWRAKECMNFAQSDEFIKPQYVIQKLHEVTNGDAWVTSDVGQHQMITNRYYRFKKQNSIVTSGGAGTMGFALPAAFGAKVAVPHREVVAVIGDGGFQMTMQELGTIAYNKLPVKIIVLNNKCQSYKI